MFKRFIWIACFISITTTVLAWQMPPAPVGVTPAREMDISREISLSGSVNPLQQSQVSALISAAVAELSVEEGDRVERGQVLVRLVDTPFRLAKDVTRAQIVETKARLQLAESELKRARELHQTKVASIQDLDRAISEAAALKGTLATLRAQEAQHDFALKHTVIRAPFNGVVVMRYTETGQWLIQGDTVFDMISISEPDVWVEVPERYYRDFSIGLPAAVVFESLPDLSLEGRVRAVIPMAGAARTFRVKISFPNQDHRVPMGILAHVALRIGNTHRALAVPKDAVLDRGGVEIVFVVDGDKKAQQVNVVSGLSNGDWVEVTGDLQPGQEVITLGNERIFPGQSLVPQERSYRLP